MTDLYRRALERLKTRKSGLLFTSSPPRFTFWAQGPMRPMGSGIYSLVVIKCDFLKRKTASFNVCVCLRIKGDIYFETKLPIKVHHIPLAELRGPGKTWEGPIPLAEQRNPKWVKITDKNMEGPLYIDRQGRPRKTWKDHFPSTDKEDLEKHGRSLTIGRVKRT